MDQTLLGNLKAHGVARRPMQYGDAQFAQVVSTIRNEGGDTVGYVVEWRDRTQEALVEAEVARVIAQAAAGDLSAASTPATRKASSAAGPADQRPAGRQRRQHRTDLRPARRAVAG
jgi:hypothetical protein